MIAEVEPHTLDLAQTPSELAVHNERINRLEMELAKLPPVEMPVTHRFTPGLYIREIFMPATALLTSKIHKTEHPFVISKGRCMVYDDNNGWVELCAPYTGITKPGTRRVLHVLEDTVWTTFHPTNETDVDVIESQLIEPHDIPEQISVSRQYTISNKVGDL